MNYGICITTFNRFDYWNQMVDSFSKTEFLPNTKIFVSDDKSSDSRVNEKSRELLKLSADVRLFQNEENIGARKHYIKNIARFENEDVGVIINVDSDGLFNKSWMKKLDELMAKFDYNVIANVFFCSRDRNNFILDKGDYIQRNSLNGHGLSFPKLFIPFIKTKIVEGDHLDHYVYRKSKEMGLKSVCTKDSYIEHIGAQGVHSVPHFYDKATNFQHE